ncbi:MAG: hypothetical protein ACRBI6_14775 [Acidimicrobiales bacterium]
MTMEPTAITLLDTRTVRLVELVELMADAPFDLAAQAVLDALDQPDPYLDPDDPLAVVAMALVKVRSRRNAVERAVPPEPLAA